MIYNNLIRNKNIYEKLALFHSTDRLPNSFIFYGGEGIGKEAHAIEFFGLINCNNPLALEACGNCNSCKKTKILQHELLDITIPFPKNKSLNKNDSALKALTEKQKSSLLEHYNQKGQNPYHKIKIEKSNTIIINSIKDIKRKINLSINDGKTKLYLILEADKLCYPNQEAANALLKVLEEPHKNNLFILVTSNINRVIDTIISRCMPIYFPNINSRKIENYIKSDDRKEQYTNVISKICNGNIQYAIELQKNITNKIQLIESLTDSLKNLDYKTWNEKIDKLNKDELFEYLNLLKIFFLDLDFINNNNHINVSFTNFIPTYKIYLEQFKNINWNDCIHSITNSYNFLLKNGYKPLIMMSLFIELKNIMHFKSVKKFNLEHWTEYN